MARGILVPAPTHVFRLDCLQLIVALSSFLWNRACFGQEDATAACLAMPCHSRGCLAHCADLSWFEPIIYASLHNIPELTLMALGSLSSAITAELPTTNSCILGTL